MAFIPAIEITALTDTGRVRAQNEDAVAFSAEFGYAILADGMGGYRAGEVASRMAVDVLDAAFREGIGKIRSQYVKTKKGQQVGLKADMIVTAIGAANSEIVKVSREDPECDGMGTTLVTAVVHGETITVGHVGDSRAYRFRNAALEQITRDHSLLQEQVDAGLLSDEEARLSVNRNLVTRAVGIGDTVNVEIRDYQILPGDVYLLCSDGLSDMLSNEEICSILMDYRASLDNACATLVQRANEHGGRDNISVILFRVQGSKGESESLINRIMNWLT